VFLGFILFSSLFFFLLFSFSFLITCFPFHSLYFRFNLITFFEFFCLTLPSHKATATLLSESSTSLFFQSATGNEDDITDTRTVLWPAEN